MNSNIKFNVQEELLLKYWNSLQGGLYKILPIYEGRDLFSKNVVFSQEDAYNHFQQYVSSLLVEIYGNSKLFFETVHAVKIVSILRGILEEIKIDEHKKLRPLVFQCVNLCKKISDELECDKSVL